MGKNRRAFHAVAGTRSAGGDLDAILTADSIITCHYHDRPGGVAKRGWCRALRKVCCRSHVSRSPCVARMFSTKERLTAKTGPNGIGRFSYLQSLVTEFQDTDSVEAKLQVLANLANFAYDPINYAYFRKLNVIDLFLDCLTEDVNGEMTEYAIGGICNVCLDKANKEYIILNRGVELAIRCLSSTRVETVLSAMTTLMYLVTPSSKQAITAEPVVDVMRRFSQSSNSRLSNLAHVFLEDYCSITPGQQNVTKPSSATSGDNPVCE